MEIKKVGDIMIPLDAYPHVPYWFTLRQALMVFLKAQLTIEGGKSLPRAILIFDKEYKLMGIVRRRDIFRGLGAREIPDKQVIMDSPEKAKDIVLQLKDRSAKQLIDVMIPVKNTVSRDELVTDAVYKMVENEASLLPVLEDEKIVGVVRSVEMLDEIAALVLEKEVRNIYYSS